MPCSKVAGYHDLYWQPAGVAYSDSLGMTGPEGVELSRDIIITPITGDALGPETVIDGIYQGGNVTISFVLQDIKLAIVKKFLSAHLDNSTFDENTVITGRPEYIGAPGRMACDFAGFLYAIPRAGTPASAVNSTGGNGRKFLGIPIGPRLEYLDTRPRFIPIQFQVYPIYEDNFWKWWQWTDDPNIN